MPDISTRQDIERLVHSFYSKLLEDEHLGHIFQETIANELEEHLEVINKFWCSVLLGEQSYKGNVMLKHIELNKTHNLEANHFDRWIELWNESITVNYSGPNADEAIKRAGLMKELMLYKIGRSSERGFVQ